MQTLAGKQILVVEDQCLIAADLADELERSGAIVIGPAATVDQAAGCLDEHPELAAAVLDIRLHDTLVFELADRLRARAVPFMFATGYDRASVPERFAADPLVRKPVASEEVLGVLGKLVRAA